MALSSENYAVGRRPKPAFDPGDASLPERALALDRVEHGCTGPFRRSVLAVSGVHRTGAMRGLP
jgi:hypothetical protein